MSDKQIRVTLPGTMSTTDTPTVEVVDSGAPVTSGASYPVGTPDTLLEDDPGIYQGLLEERDEAMQKAERSGIDMRAWKQRAETAEAEVERLRAIESAAKSARTIAGDYCRHSANCQNNPCETCEGLDCAKRDAECELDMLLFGDMVESATE